MSKVLFVLTTLGQGGAEQYTLRYMNYDRENDFTVITSMGVGGVLEDEYRKVSTVILNCGFGYLKFINWVKVYWFLRREKFDTIIDMHGGMSGIMMWISKKAKIANRIAFYRNTNAGYSPTWYKRIYENFSRNMMVRNATKVLSNSEAALNKFHAGWKYHRDKFKVVYNGLDIKALSNKTREEERSSLGIPINAFVVGHSGRVCWQKNHEMILCCAEMLLNKYDNILFLLMGQGTDTHFTDKVRELGLEGRIRLMGNRCDVLDVIKCLDVYYFPSKSEGQPNALIEAMVSGIPIATSNIDTIIETVPDYIKQNLVSPDDKLANFELLEKMYLDPIFRKAQICDLWAKEHFDADKNFGFLKSDI